MKIGGNWALIPIKAQAEAKSRLSGMLTPVQRRELQTAMLADLLQGLSESRLLDGVAIYAPEELAMPAGLGRPVIQFAQASHVRDLNAAVADGAGRLARLGAQFVAVLPGDLPLLEAADLDSALSLAASRTCRLVMPDRWKTGTNGLVFPSDAPPRFHYGSDSFTRHALDRCMNAAAHRTTVLELRSFFFDIDTPEDISQFLNERHGVRGAFTRGLIESLDCTSKIAKTWEMHI